MDEIDHRIVALLRENARRSFQDIGERVSLSAPAVKRRVDRLEARRRHPRLLGEHRSLGDRLEHARLRRALLRGPDVGRRGERRASARNPEVEAAYTIAGAPSAILHLRAADTQHLEEALERVRDTPGVVRTQTQVVLSTLFERRVING